MSTHASGRVTETNIHHDGPIPSCLGTLANLTRLDLHHSRFTVPMPGQLGNLVKLGQLEPDHNRLSGQIPVKLESLTNSNHLELNHNNLTGCISAEALPHLRMISNLAAPDL